ncbi:MAG: acyl-CoA dehydrogenase family protein [Chloroflexi bacterium]|nr:acyl-CoA dehydrogenase family protein [Chloroflexota bacterium]
MEFELSYTPDQEAFRQDVRAWLQANVPAGISRSPRVEEHPQQEWEQRRVLARRLGAKGWLWPTMPREYGGGGLSMDQAIIIAEELDSLGLHSPPYHDSATLVAPSVLVWGSDEQKKAFLPPMLKGEVVTFQCLTEPEVGSDLASVKSSAVKDGDEYVLNGHKTFIGAAHGVDWMWTIAVTDPKAPRHENVSWFIIPANSPGVTIIPMELLGSRGEDGNPEGHKNDIYLDSVRVPAFNLIGGENQGWRVASTHLELEHGGGGRIVRNAFEREFWKYIETAQRDGRHLAEDPDARDVLADIQTDNEITRLLGMRNFYLAHARKPRSYEGSQSSYMRKTAGLRMTHLMGQLLGYQALTTDAEYRIADGHIESQQRSGIINVHPGGTTDIQKLIIARRIGIGRTAKEEAGRLS